MSRIDLKKTVLTLTESGGRYLLVKLGDGNLQYTEKQERQYFKNCGRLDAVRDGDEQPVEVRLDATWEFISNGGGEIPTIEDVLKQRNAASEWTSTDSDSCQPYALDLVLTLESCDTIEGEMLRFQQFRYEELAHDAKNATIAVSGKCKAVMPFVGRTPQIETAYLDNPSFAVLVTFDRPYLGDGHEFYVSSLGFPNLPCTKVWHYGGLDYMVECLNTGNIIHSPLNGDIVFNGPNGYSTVIVPYIPE